MHAMSIVSDDYRAWLQKQGVKWKKITAGFVQEGWRGMTASENIAPGDVLVEIPEVALLHSRSTSVRSEVDSILASCPLSDGQLLAIVLLLEIHKGVDSFWQPFLASMPQSYTSLAYFQPHHLETLQDEHAALIGKEVERRLEVSWQSCRPAMHQLNLRPELTTLESYRWACATKDSRVMHFPGTSAGTFVPFADFFNYRPPPAPEIWHLNHGEDDGENCDSSDKHPSLDYEANVCGDGSFDPTSQSYKIVAHQGYVAGDQVFLCYGAHTNLELLEHYGFVLEDNPYDTVMVAKGTLPRAISSSPEFQALAPKQCFLHANGVPSWDLMKALRLSCMQPAERKYSYLAHEGKVCSMASERKAMKVLLDWCQHYLTAKQTTLKDDREILARLDAATDEMLCLAILWRIKQKSIVELAANLASNYLQEQQA